MILLVLAAGSVQAEKKLEVIDLAPESVSAEDKAAGQRYQATQPCATSKGSKAVKRWFAGEVIKWARQNRAKLPCSRSPRRPV